MTIRGIQLGGLIELAAFVLVGVFVALLTLLPWWLAILIYGLFWLTALRLRKWNEERKAARVRRLDRDAERERIAIRAEGERREALRVVGGIERSVPR